jgi:hypothetical protein
MASCASRFDASKDQMKKQLCRRQRTKRLLASIAGNDENGWFVTTIEDMLRAVAVNDTARTELLLASIIRRRNAPGNHEPAE